VPRIIISIGLVTGALYLDLALAGQAVGGEMIGVVPKPASMKVTGGREFELTPTVSIVHETEIAKKEAEYLAERLRPATGLALPVRVGTDGRILLTSRGADPALGKEGYELAVSPEGVVIRAPQATGLFYGVQSLRQLLPVAIFGKKRSPDTKWTIPCVTIRDMPRFAWRAFMLDEGRYFKGMQVVKDLLDEMALLKMNVFHWHLVDDQGWRIEIKKYPRLVEIGSKRPGTALNRRKPNELNGVPHEGAYTQEQVREIVRYAAERHITVIPEIEMPGHASASIAAYPEWGSIDEPIKVPCAFGRKLNCYNVADQKVYDALVDILDEVIALFPAEVLHIGGDEVNYAHWSRNDRIKAYMREHGLKSMYDVQIHFTNRMSRTLAEKGRRMMGWNEILGIDEKALARGDERQVELSKKAIIHFWKGSAALAMEAVKRGYDVVNSWHSYTYLDYNFGRINLQKAYEFDPVFEGLDPKYHDKIIGLGCQMWGERIPSVKSMQLRIFPRIGAYAEVGWTPAELRSYREFETRIRVHCERWKLMNVAYVTGEGRNKWSNRPEKKQ